VILFRKALRKSLYTKHRSVFVGCTTYNLAEKSQENRRLEIPSLRRNILRRVWGGRNWPILRHTNGMRLTNLLFRRQAPAPWGPESPTQ
jgi:hypothetical protein